MRSQQTGHPLLNSMSRYRAIFSAAWTRRTELAGQILVALDPTLATANTSSVQEQLKAAGSELYRSQALLSMLLNVSLE